MFHKMTHLLDLNHFFTVHKHSLRIKVMQYVNKINNFFCGHRFCGIPTQLH